MILRFWDRYKWHVNSSHADVPAWRISWKFSVWFSIIGTWCFAVGTSPMTNFKRSYMLLWKRLEPLSKCWKRSCFPIAFSVYDFTSLCASIITVQPFRLSTSGSYAFCPSTRNGLPPYRRQLLLIHVLVQILSPLDTSPTLPNHFCLIPCSHFLMALITTWYYSMYLFVFGIIDFLY